MSTLPAPGKISADAHACVDNLTSALYCALNKHFCVIRVPFVATSPLACRWMCNSPWTGCARRLTPMWREQAKTYTHIYVTEVSFWELIIVYPNGGQWAPSAKFPPLAPLAQTTSYATDQTPNLPTGRRTLYHWVIAASCWLIVARYQLDWLLDNTRPVSFFSWLRYAKLLFYDFDLLDWIFSESFQNLWDTLKPVCCFKCCLVCTLALLGR